jgi:molybdopterin-containing oxidoreductase family membrane subunit
MSINVLGVFDTGSKAATAIRSIRRDRLGDVEVYGPAPDHAIDQALEVTVSPVRVFVLVGGLLGCLSGFALPIYTVLDWPLITGGMPLISIPPFVVIAFELTILFAAIAGLVGFFGLAGLPRFRKPVVDDPRFTNDRFGVLVTCADSGNDAVKAHLTKAGAEEVREHA